MSRAQAKQAVSINIRAKAPQRDLIDRAAQRQGRSRSEFMLNAACREAEEVLLDQAFFTLGPEAFARMRELIDKPLPATPALRKLLDTKAPWDK